MYIFLRRAALKEKEQVLSLPGAVYTAVLQGRDSSAGTVSDRGSEGPRFFWPSTEKCPSHPAPHFSVYTLAPALPWRRKSNAWSERAVARHQACLATADSGSRALASTRTHAGLDDGLPVEGACPWPHTGITVGSLPTQQLEMTAVGFEPTPLRNGALSHRLRPLGHTVSAELYHW